MASRSRSPHGHGDPLEDLEAKHHELEAKYHELALERAKWLSERDELRRTISELEREKSDLSFHPLHQECNHLRSRNIELEQENALLRRYKIFQEGVQKLLQDVELGTHEDDSSDPQCYEIEDIAGSDTEEVPPLTCAPMLLDKPISCVSALALENAPIQLALENGSGPLPNPAANPDMNERILEQIAHEISCCKKKKSVLVIVGAGMSTSCGIQDFRTPGLGLYSTLEKTGLPYPEALFDLAYFKEKPEPFYRWASQNWPGDKKPSRSHYFLQLLYKEEKLLRCYTQNIDGLERKAGMTSRLVEAHGSFNSAHVVETGKQVNRKTLKTALERGTWEKLRQTHGGLVKPNIVFFGEELPLSFSRFLSHDYHEAEILLVLGTSLNIEWTRRLAKHCNAKKKFCISLGEVRHPWSSHNEGDWDLFARTDCDSACQEIAKHLGWSEKLHNACAGCV